MANQVAYGLVNMRDLFNQRVREVGVDIVNTAVDDTLAEHTRQLNALSSIFIETTEQFKAVYETPQTARLQPLDDNGRARQVKGFGKYEVGLPIQQAGIAHGANFRTREKMTVAEVNRTLNMLTGADGAWVRDHILGAIYHNAEHTFSDDQYGSLVVKPLANGDTQQYMIQQGGDAGATDNHYLAQTASIAAANNPFPLIEQELMEHPENSGEVVVFVPTNLIASVKALPTFLAAADPNVTPAANAQTLRRELGLSTPGTLVGYVDKCWIVEWKRMPDNYMIATTTDGDKPLRMREEPEASLKGFKRVADRDDHPFYESQYLRIAGFGAWNRLGALVYRIGSASYTAAPTGYALPMP